MHQIDHVLVSANTRKLSEDYQVDKINTMWSYHQAPRVVIRLRVQKKTPKPKKKINWCKFIHSNIMDDFNRKLKSILANCVDTGYREFGKHIKSAAKDAVLETLEKMDDSNTVVKF